MEYITKGATETKELGKKLSADLTGGEIIALVGELGAGKTTFVQGFAEGLGVERVISPTFVLMREHKIKKAKFENFYHVDLYRLEGDVVREMENIGIFDLWAKPNNLFVIEWADKAREVFPKNTMWVEFKYLDENVRSINTLRSAKTLK